MAGVLALLSKPLTTRREQVRIVIHTSYTASTHSRIPGHNRLNLPLSTFVQPFASDQPAQAVSTS